MTAAVRMEMTFVLPDKYDSNWVSGSRTPDILFIAAQRMDGYKAAHSDWREKPYLLVPDMVVEVVSPNDRYSDFDEKVDAYLAAAYETLDEALIGLLIVFEDDARDASLGVGWKGEIPSETMIKQVFVSVA